MARYDTLPPAQRSLAASVGSLHRWSKVNSPEARRAATAPATAARRRSLELEVDPLGVLPPDELAAAVDRRRRAHMKQLALASAAKRRKAA